MTSGHTRGCQHCGQSITVTGRNPNRRYCTDRCRVADWHARNDRRLDVSNAVPRDDVRNGVPNGVLNRPGVSGHF